MTAKKPAGKAKSAVSGKFITKAAAKANPRETYLEENRHQQCVRLQLSDLRLMRRCFDWRDTGKIGLTKSEANRILREIDRALAGHEKEA